MNSIESILSMAESKAMDDALTAQMNHEKFMRNVGFPKQRTNKMSNSDIERERFEDWYIQNFHDGDIHPNQHLLGRNSIDDYVCDPVDEMYQAWQAATQSKQSEIDELCRRISDLINACADHVTVRVDYKNRIDLLESAIREFLKEDDELIIGCAGIETLRNLLEKSK